MSSLADRLGRALRPRYLIEGVLAGGGMAVVLEARDPSLDRRLAIKVLRPEHATARGAKRFLKEARTIARLSHPNVVTVHEAGEADGLYYLVMDYVEGETLRERLARGPLSPEEAVAVGLDILAALDAAHEAGVVHRDVKPGNIFLGRDRALLGDFGIAKLETTSEEGLTVPGARPGTPGYMAPEQALGEKVTPRADLYAVGAVLYEALTGRRWSALDDPGDADWSGVRARLAVVLRRALERVPVDRWVDARAFRAALERSRRSLRPAAAAAVALGAALAAGVALWRVLGGDGADRPSVPLATADLALLPCEASPADSLLGDDVARAAASYLPGLPGFRVTPYSQAGRWAASQPERDFVAAARELRAAHVVDCKLQPARDDTLRLLVYIRNADGALRVSDRIQGADKLEAGERLARSVLDALYPQAGRLSGYLKAHDLVAIGAYFRGEQAWERDARQSAERHFRNALEIDSSFALARWRLADIRRWIPKAPGEDLQRLYERHASDLPEFHRRLIQAKLAEMGPPQFALYERVLADFPLDAYATLLYGDELLHRGPLFGVSPDSALRVLELAVSQDPFLAPAWDHVVHAHIRSGRRAETEAALARLEGVAAGPEEDPFPVLLRQAFFERFEPASAAATRDTVFATPVGRALLSLAARYGLLLNLPHTQDALGGALVERSGGHRLRRTSGHTARGLAGMALGRPAAALAQFDSAAQSLGGRLAGLEAAQWRVVPAALGYPGLPPAEVARGRAALERMAGDDGTPAALRLQAAWSLVLDGEDAARWDTETRRLAPRAGDEADVSGLLRLLDGLEAARGLRLEAALEVTRPLVAYDSARRETQPFVQPAVYALRGEWQERLGHRDSAAATWGWVEHMDLGSVWHEEVSDERSALPTAGEVDWALGPVVRLRRARLLAELDRDAEACALLDEVLRFWDDPEPGVEAERSRAEALRRERCRAR